MTNNDQRLSLFYFSFYTLLYSKKPCSYSVHISIFSRRWCLRNHLKTVHLEEKPFKCKFCNCQTSFASEGRLTTHVLRVHEKVVVSLTRLIYELRILTGKSRWLRFIPILAYIKDSLYHLSTLLFFRILNWYAGVSNSVVFHFDSNLKKRCQITPLSTFHLKRNCSEKYLVPPFLEIVVKMKNPLRLSYL